jgi:hypothetical protein
MESTDCIFRLAPLQESILLQALISPEPGTGLQQVVVRLPLRPNRATRLADFLVDAGGTPVGAVIAATIPAVLSRESARQKTTGPAPP